jgi:hypothetical protein
MRLDLPVMVLTTQGTLNLGHSKIHIKHYKVILNRGFWQMYGVKYYGTTYLDILSRDV